MAYVINPDTGELEIRETATSIGAIDRLTTDDANSAIPVAGEVNILGGEGIDTSSSGNTVTISGENASDTNKGIASFQSGQFSVVAGHVSLAGGGLAIDEILTDSGAPSVKPDGNGQIQIIGGTGIDVTGQGPGNIVTVKIDNATVGQTITGDSGGALSPTAGNWNVLGRSGSKTSGAGSTLTINSPPYSDRGGSTSVTLNTGSFATAAITLTTPLTAGLADGDLLEFVATNGVLVIQLAATQVAHIGTIATTAAGTMTSTATGDSVSLRYQASTNDWWATSVIGTWVLA